MEHASPPPPPLPFDRYPTNLLRQYFSLAVRDGDLATLDLLLQPPTLSKVYSSISNALAEAAGHQHLEVINRLLQVPALRPTVAASRSNLALRWACGHRHMPIMSRLLTCPGVVTTPPTGLSTIIQRGTFEDFVGYMEKFRPGVEDPSQALISCIPGHAISNPELVSRVLWDERSRLEWGAVANQTQQTTGFTAMMLFIISSNRLDWLARVLCPSDPEWCVQALLTCPTPALLQPLAQVFCRLPSKDHLFFCSWRNNHMEMLRCLCVCDPDMADNFATFRAVRYLPEGCWPPPLSQPPLLIAQTNQALPECMPHASHHQKTAALGVGGKEPNKLSEEKKECGEQLRLRFEQVQHLTSWDRMFAVQEAARGNAAGVKRILQHIDHPRIMSKLNVAVFLSAVQFGQTHVITTLRSLQNFSLQYDRELPLKHDDAATLEFLFCLPRSVLPKELIQNTLAMAAASGFSSCVKVLLQHEAITPAAIDQAWSAAYWAAKVEVLLLLLNHLTFEACLPECLCSEDNPHLPPITDAFLQRALQAHVPLPVVKLFIHQHLKVWHVAHVSSCAHPLVSTVLHDSYGCVLDWAWLKFLSKGPSSQTRIVRRWNLSLKDVPLWEQLAGIKFLDDPTWVLEQMVMFYRETCWQVWTSCQQADPTQMSHFVWPLILDFVMGPTLIDFRDELCLKKCVDEFQCEQDSERRLQLVDRINQVMCAIARKVRRKVPNINMNKCGAFSDVMKVLFFQQQ